MNEREKILRLAAEAGAYWEHGDFNMPCVVRFDRESDIERFATLVTAHEHEACAQACEAKGQVKGGEIFAARIRARSKK